MNPKAKLALYIALYALWAAREFPGTADEQKSAAMAWLYGLLFMPVAWQHYQKARTALKQENWAAYGQALKDLEQVLIQMKEGKR